MGRLCRVTLGVGLLVALYAAAWILPDEVLPEAPECYLSATWTGCGWEYGSVVCFDPELAWLEMDVDILAGVALNEDPTAPAAVMWVVLNRAEGQLLETVATPAAFHGLREETPIVTPWDRRRWARLREVAWDVLLGLRNDPTGGARHFHRRGTWTPPWAPERASWVSLGAHHFYG